MTKLADLAVVLRSKNAGVAYITIDILFGEPESYEAAKAVLTRDRIADAYGLRSDQLTDFVTFDQGRAIKATLPRSRITGGDGLGETDLYGSGQYAPLLAIEVPDAALPAGGSA